MAVPGADAIKKLPGGNLVIGFATAVGLVGLVAMATNPVGVGSTLLGGAASSVGAGWDFATNAIG